MSPSNLKKYFSIFQHSPELIYLDNASTTQTPDCVVKAMDEYYSEYRANTHRGLYPISERATEAFELSRHKVAKFLSAEPEEVVFTRSATHSLNILANGLCRILKPGDEIVLTEAEHHSNLVPWQQMAERYQLTIKFLPIDSHGLLVLDSIPTVITERTKIVSCTHASNVLGIINPIQKIAEQAKKVGAVMIVDACQSIPHQAINVKDLDCDFVVFSAHKMCGPTGVGVLYGKLALLETLEPLEFGGHMISEVTFAKSTFAGSPERFEAGTANIGGVIGFGATIDFLQNLDWAGIHQHEQILMQAALEQLTAIPEVEVHGPIDNKNRTSVISFNIKNIHSHDTAHILALNHIAVRAGHHCAQPLLQKLGIKNSVRASFYFYTTMEDVLAFTHGVQRVLHTMNR